MKNNILEELKWRNILKDVSNSEKIISAQNNKKGIYCGFDPTNVSLHLGNLLQVILLRRFALYGFQPIALIGGATAMIGDPSGKSQERNLLNALELNNNVMLITKQLNELINYQNIDNLSSLELIENFGLLSKDDSRTLSMIINSINLNAKYKDVLLNILKKLPIPFIELNLEKHHLLNIYKIFNLDINYLNDYLNLSNFDFSALLHYFETWKNVWADILNLAHGQENILDVKKIRILNNHTWLSTFDILNFLRDIGKNFNVNQMLSKDVVASRLQSGISYSEFSYQILQAYDFYHLYKNENCFLQSGGSDQWGNITAGLDFIRKKVGDEHDGAGLTVNLLTKSDGKKFGKTEKGAIFLDKNKTSTYEFYQFLLNQDDKDLVKLFSSLTFLSEEQINDIINLHNLNPAKRVGQKILASLLTIYVHNIEGFFQAIKITQALFNNELNKLTTQEILEIFKDVLSFNQEKDELLIEVLLKNEIVSSKRQAREFLNANALEVNGCKISDEKFLLTKQQAINRKISLIKKGKKNYFLIFHNY